MNRSSSGIKIPCATSALIVSSENPRLAKNCSAARASIAANTASLAACAALRLAKCFLLLFICLDFSFFGAARIFRRVSRKPTDERAVIEPRRSFLRLPQLVNSRASFDVQPDGRGGKAVNLKMASEAVAAVLSHPNRLGWHTSPMPEEPQGEKRSANAG
jgi:hypothetical protein